MKNFFLGALLLLCQTAYALPVGNPSEATLFSIDKSCCSYGFGPFSFGIGFYGDYVFNRHMKTVRGKDIDTTKISTNAGYLVANICNKADIFAALGVSRLSLNTSLGAFNAVDPHPLFEIESGSSFSFTVGQRATLYQCGPFSFGAVWQYFQTEPNLKRLYIAAGAVSYPDDILRTRYKEWQFAAGISYCFNEFFIPYAAIRYAHASWKLANGRNFIIEENTNTFLHNLKNSKNLGYAVGLTFRPPVCQKAAVTVEGRFASEKAFYVNGQVRF